MTERFTTLVDAGVPIPLFVTRLTGIEDADVAGAPGIAEALAELRAFAGDAVLVGHNAAFDRDHLAAAARGPARRRWTTSGSTRWRRPCCSIRSSTATRCRCWPRS